MFHLATIQDVAFPSTLARGRGLGKLLEGLWEGDPTAWTILVVIVVAMVGWSILKRKFGGNDE